MVPPRRVAAAAPRPLSDADLDRLQALLDSVPAPLEPLDVSMVDGFLCGVLLQPARVAPAAWLPRLTDVDGRPLPERFDTAALHALARRRHAELEARIEARQWFDPWVFEFEADGASSVGDAAYPWVAGFATANELFPGLMALDPKTTLEPLALLYRYLGADDLEDADDLLAEIETLEPPADLAEVVEDLVQAVLLLADAARPRAAATRPTRRR